MARQSVTASSPDANVLQIALAAKLLRPLPEALAAFAAVHRARRRPDEPRVHAA